MNAFKPFSSSTDAASGKEGEQARKIVAEATIKAEGIIKEARATAQDIQAKLDLLQGKVLNKYTEQSEELLSSLLHEQKQDWQRVLHRLAELTERQVTLLEGLSAEKLVELNDQLEKDTTAYKSELSNLFSSQQRHYLDLWKKQVLDFFPEILPSIISESVSRKAQEEIIDSRLQALKTSAPWSQKE